MKRIAIFLAVLLVVAVTVALVAPSFVDWNEYRDELARAISNATGREVAIRGDLDLAILPGPHLVARDFSMANVAGAEERDMIRVSELRLQFSLAPLLRGVFAFTNVSLIEPVIALERTAQGRTSWDFAEPKEEERETGAAPGAFLAEHPVQISVQRITVTDGVLTWRDAGGEAERLQDLDADIVANGPAGGYRIEGGARYRDVPLTLVASLGRLGKEAPVPVTAILTLPDDAAILHAAFHLDLPAGEASGTVRLTAADAAAMVRTVFPNAGDSAPAQPFALESAIHASSGELELAGLELRLGDTAGSGRAVLRLDGTPSLAAELAIPVLDLDGLIATMATSNGGAGTADTAPPQASGPSFPEGVTVKADFTAGTVRLRGGLVRDARVSATLEDGILAVTSAVARLPGGTGVSLSGQAAAEAGEIAFSGELVATSDNFRAALVWAGIDDKAIPPDRLRGFSYTSRVAVAPDAVHLTDITARLDATRLTGGITVARRTRPSFGLRLSLDRLNLDDYLPQPVGKDGGRNGGSGGDGSGTAVFGKFDANLDLSVGNLSWRGETARDVRLEGRVIKGSATLTSLAIADLSGAAVKGAGRIADLSGSPDVDLDVAVEGRDPERFARFIGLANGGAARRFGRFRIDAHVGGTAERAAVKGTLTALGGSMSASGSIANVLDKPAYDLAISLGKPDGRRLLALVAPEPRWGDVGAVSGRFGLKGESGRLAVRELDIVIGEMPVTGTADVDFSGKRPKIGVVLTAGHLLLDRFLPGAGNGGTGGETSGVRGNARWSREGIDLSFMREAGLDLSLKLASLQRRDIRIDGADIHAGLAGGKLTIDRFTGAAFSGRIELSGTVDATGPGARIEARLDGKNLEAHTAFGTLLGFDRLQGPVEVQATLKTSGASEFALISALSGTARVTGTVKARLSKEERTKAGVAGLVGALVGRKVKEAGFASDALVSLLQSFADAPADLHGDIAIDKGRAQTENLTLEGRGARAVTVGAADLANWTVESATTLRRDIDAGADPYMVIRLKGPLDDPDIATSGTWLRRPSPVAPLEAPQQPAAPETPALQTEQPPPDKPEKIDPKQLFLELLKRGLQK